MGSHDVPIELQNRTSTPGPVFISGRQHSGNTLTATILGRMPGCFAMTNEGIFFEQRHMVDKIADDARRARWVVDQLKLPDEQLAHDAQEWMTQWVRQHRAADGLALYREVMRFLTETTGNHFWAQKATSYVFYAREILTAMPDARMVYLMRNPFDLCASTKRRAGREVDPVVGPALGWNGGVKTIHLVNREFAGRVHITRYEDLVTDPEASVQALCDFLGTPFSADLLDVPHINPSENRYQVVEGSKGINRSRLYYYMDQIPKHYIAAVEILLSTPLLREHYPQLPHNEQRFNPVVYGAALCRIVVGLICYAVDRVRWARRSNTPLIRRTYRRLIAIRS